MSAPNRSNLITALQKVLKKHYKPVPPETKRTVLQNLLYGCLLDNARYQDADAAWTRLQDEFFDWNEVRVATSRELAEYFPMLPDPIKAADRIRQALQNVFEGLYAFDLELLQKENLGKATQKLEKFVKLSPFAVGYVVQTSLGGHSIPLDDGAMAIMLIVDIVTEKEAAERRVPGLERAVPKSKGREFGSLLHQLSADFMANKFSPTVHKTLLEINPDAKDRLPKRGSKSSKKKSAKGSKSSGKAAAKTATSAPKKTTKKAKATSAKSATKSTTASKKKTTKRKPR